jgi:hypothetical protein
MNKIALANRLSLRIMLVVMVMAIVIMAVVYPIIRAQGARVRNLPRDW